MTNPEIIQLLKQYRTHLLKLGSYSEYDYQETRTFLNKNRALVQRILTCAGTLRFVDVAPPPMFGGYMMRNVNPMDLIFDPPYGLDIHSHLSDVIEQTIGIIEANPGFAARLEARPKKDDREYDVWALIHPQIAEVSKKRMNDGYYADAVEAACKAVNTRVRDYVQDQTGEELDGAGLMKKAFSPGNPIIKIANVENKSGHDTQQGFMEIFAGVMTGIRNPKAHDNETITKEDALRKLIMISLLMYKIDGRLITD
ncbi:MAG: TIGR02391 family protein [Bacteroidaceae bacterium]|nr:TIGR02391 family protein [Bacteroidaceae bacterium]